MNDWLLTILGFDPERIPDGAETDFIFTRAPQSWGVFVLLAVVAAIIYGVVFLYRRETDTAPRGAKLLLATIRAAVVIVLALVLIGPALAISQRRTVQPYVLVLLDESQSMSIQDRYASDKDLAPVTAATGRTADEIRGQKPSRMSLVEEVLEKDAGRLMRELAERGKIRMFAYSNKVRPLDTRPVRSLDDDASGSSPSGEDTRATSPNTATSEPQSSEPAFELPPLEPSGQGTLTAKAIREALKTLAGNRIAGIVLIGDGQDTAKEDDPVDVAALAASQRVPILTVGVGDASPPQNLKVTDLFADDQVWQGDPFEIQASIEAVGVDQDTIEVELIEQLINEDTPGGDDATQRSVIERRSVNLVPDGGLQTISFKYTPKKTGQFAYSVQLPTLPTEFTDRDNQKSVPVKVVSEKARVLLISGGPMWEYRLVQGLLTRDKTVDLSCWLQSMDVDMKQEGDTPIDRLPHQAEELLKYDLIMMFDPDPSEFNDAWFENLKKFLGEHAGGFLYMAGPKYSTRFLADPRASALRDVLPVRLGDLGATEIEMLTAKNSKEWPLALVQSNLGHPIMSFDIDPAANQGRWERMPGVYWSFPAASAKPATRTLLEHSDPNLRRAEGTRPLLVAGQYGAGRTAYLGFTGTWRWRQLGRDAEYFNKFWIQVTRYLVEGSLLEGKRRGVIETGSDVFRLGDNVTITARLTDPLYQPLAEPVVRATLTAPGVPETQVELKQVQDQPGQYEGSVAAMHLNLNELSLTLPGEANGKPVRITKQFSVTLPRVEFDDPRLNKALLVDIAERSGGRYFDLDELDQLAQAIPEATETIVVPDKPAELWDTNRVLILLVGLLTIEWGLRKRFKLM